MLRKILAVLILLIVGGYFLTSSEGDSVAILDWLRDPAGSQQLHYQSVERDRLRTTLAPLDELDFDLGEGGFEEPEAIVEPVVVREDPLEPVEPDLFDVLIGSPDEVALETLLASSGYALHGRLVGLDGSPLSGVALEAQQPGQAPSTTRSDRHGAFELMLRGADGVLSIDPQAWVVLAGSLALTPGLSLQEGERLLVLAPRLDLVGQVVDEQGQPLADVEVHAQTELAAAAALRILPLVPDRIEMRTRSDADGRFRFERMPHVGRGRVRLELEGRSAELRSFEELGREPRVTLSVAPGSEEPR